MQNSYVHVGYKLPSSEIWKFQNIPSEVYDLCSKEDKLLVLHEEQVYDPKDLIIFKDTVKNVEWINWEQADDGDEDDIRGGNYEGDVDFADIVGQEGAKRGLEIAAAGGHNVIMAGPCVLVRYIFPLMMLSPVIAVMIWDESDRRNGDTDR